MEAERERRSSGILEITADGAAGALATSGTAVFDCVWEK